MYKIEEYKSKIISILGDLERNTTLKNKAGMFDINKEAEEFYRGLLNLSYGWNLKALNTEDDPNYEGVDLGDSDLGIAVQITSEKNSDKVHHSIKGFKNKCLAEGYKELYILMFRGKSEFPKANFSKSVGAKFTFEKSKHIIDHSDLSGKLRDIEFERLKSIYDYLIERTGNDEVNRLVSHKIPVNAFPQRLTYFTGRVDVLEDVRGCLEKHRQVSIHGIHGLGKSSIINEFVYIHGEKYSKVIFLRATDAEFDTFVSETIRDLGFEASDEIPPNEKLKALQIWLATHDNWLLILDNVENIERIQSCNFPNDKGYIIYTSNSSEIHQIGFQVKVDNMGVEDARLLLYRHKEQNPEISEILKDKIPIIQEIAQKFGNSPLAMTFVGSYIAQKRKSWDEFLKDYNDRERNLLRTHTFLSNYQYKEVATAFLITFEQITTPKNDSEREIFLSEIIKNYLELCTILSPSNMPEEFFIEYLTRKFPTKNKWLEREDFVDEVKERLYSFSLFERNSDEKLLITHPLSNRT